MLSGGPDNDGGGGDRLLAVCATACDGAASWRSPEAAGLDQAEHVGSGHGLPAFIILPIIILLCIMIVVMSTFVDRHEPLRDLETRFRGAAAEFLVVYGRRRIGKSALLREFCRGTECPRSAPRPACL
jgi:hypothetical protein